jgi:gamma-glutamylcysteine synthetase
LDKADEGIIDLLASASNVLEFKPSEQARTRVWELVAREKTGMLAEAEKSELDHYGQIEHLLRLVKARARRRQQKRTA